MKKIIAVITAALLFQTINHAQVKLVTLGKNVAKPPITMIAFKTTPVFQNRQTQYKSSFSNPGKTIAYPDGSNLHITLIKSPSFGGQSNSITPHAMAYTGPIHGVTPPPTAPGGFTCTSSVVSLSATSTNFLNADYSQQALHLYPGAIYTFDNFFNGSYHEETGARNAINVGTDNPNASGSGYVTVQNPDQFKIHDAISTLFSQSGNNTGTGSLQYHMYESSNSSDMNLKITAGGSGYGATFNNVFNTSNQQQHEYMTIDARKELFTLYTVPPDNGFFTDASHEGAQNLMYIGSVTYGVRVLANFETTFASQQDADNFSGSYNGYGVTANVDLNYLSSSKSVNSTINAYVVGGPGNSTISFDKTQLQNQITSILAGATYQNARPISYQLYDMAGDVIGSQSATDQFVTQTCVPANQPINLQTALVSVRCGDDGKDHDTHYDYEVYNGAGKLIASYSNNSNSTEFAANSSYPNQLSLSGSSTILDFMNNGGGKLHIHIVPNGHDTWKLATITLTLNYSNGQTKTINWSNAVVSQDNPAHDFYFNSNFQAQ